MQKPRNTEGQQKKGKGSSKADMMRQLAWTTLTNLTRKKKQMTVSTLKKELEKMLSIPLRSDNLIGTLISDDRFEIVKEKSGMMIGLVTEKTRKAKKIKTENAGLPPSVRMGLEKDVKKLSIEEFIDRALDTLSTNPKYEGQFHTVYSGFNKLFREYFPGSDPIEETQKLVASGKLSAMLVRGGVILSRPKQEKRKLQLEA